MRHKYSIHYSGEYNMSFNLLTEAIYDARFDPHTKKSIQVLEQTLGKNKARTIIEGYQIKPSDYKKWLGVIKGYAYDEGIRLGTKSLFVEVARAVLENDPAPIDVSMQDAIANALWAQFKAQQQHSKVEKITKAQEEEEQLTYALNRMRGGYEEEEDQMYYRDNMRSGCEDEEQFAHQFEDMEFGDTNEEEDWNEDQFSGSHYNNFDDNLDDFEEDNDDYPDYPEYEEEENGCRFTHGQLVQYKKDSGTYKVEIPDGPGDNVGIIVGGRIRMIPSKDLIIPNASQEDEEKIPFNVSYSKVNGLSNVLSGTNSQQHLKKLQNEIEIIAANTWTKHHAKLPPNPHPKGSLAYKAWERGVKKAATEIWAPKPVGDQKSKQKTKKNTRH